MNSTRTPHTRFLFDFDPLRDGTDYQGNLIARSPSGWLTGTFDRAGTVGTATSVDANGRLFVPGYKSPRFYHSYDSTTGLFLPRGLLLEGSRVNLCLQSEDFGTTWTAVNSPSLTAAAHTASGVSLDLLNDDSAAATEYYTQAITFTADAVKAISVFVKQGGATSSVVRLRDDTAGAYRLIAVVTWSGAVPSVAMTTGTYLGSERRKDGVYRLLFATTSVTAANTNTLGVHPANDATLANVALTGTIYAGGVQAENATFPSSYIKTTTAAVTRSADALSFACNIKPQAMTVYFKTVELGSVLGANAASRIFSLGGASAGRISLFCNGSSVYRTQMTNGGAGVNSAAAATPAIGDVVEHRVLVSATGTVTLGQSVNAAAEVVAAESAAEALLSAWGNTTLDVGSVGGASNAYSGFQSLRIAAGSQTLDYMRAA